jgi:hypothetical protein
MLKLSLLHNGHALSMHLHYSFTSSLFFCLAIFTQISHAKVNGFADSSFGTVDECKIIQGSGNCPCSDTNLLRGSLESVAERATLTVSPPPHLFILCKKGNRAVNSAPFCRWSAPSRRIIINMIPTNNKQEGCPARTL